MRTLAWIAIASMSLWITNEANAQLANKGAVDQTQTQEQAQKFSGQRRQGNQGRRGQGPRAQGKQGQGPRAQGQQGKGQGGQRGQGHRGGTQMIEFLFTRFDKDKNGKISESEAPDRMKQRFSNLDTNGDNSVSKEELQAVFEKMAGQQEGNGAKGGKGKGQGKNGAGKGQGQGQGRRGGQSFDPAQLIQRFDKNNDGILSLDEAPEKMKDRFDRVDGNSDGQVTVEELKATFDKAKSGQFGRDKSANPDATKPVKPKRPPFAGDGA